MANSDWLVVLIILKKYEFVNGKDYYIPYIMEKTNVWNHQPADYRRVTTVFCLVLTRQPHPVVNIIYNITYVHTPSAPNEKNKSMSWLEPKGCVSEKLDTQHQVFLLIARNTS